MDIIIKLPDGLEIKPQYTHGQQVYIKTDPEQLVGIITEIGIKPGGMVVYEVFRGTIMSGHYGFELSLEKNLVLSTQ